MTNDTYDPLFTEKQLSGWTGLSIPSLQRMRVRGCGPRFVQLSERRIGYRKSVIENWLETRTISRSGASFAPTMVAGAKLHPTEKKECVS